MIRELKNNFRNGNAILRLIFINAGVFIAVSVLDIFFYFGGKQDAFEAFVTNWFWASSDLKVLITRPWTVCTYMFMHNHLDIFHILFNMLYLFFFGRILMDFVQQRYITPLYLICGLAGIVASVTLYNVLPHFHDRIGIPSVGASAAVMGIVLAATAVAPNYSVFLFFIGPVKLKYIALFLVIVDLVSIPSEDNFGGHIAHLAGALTGFLFIKSYQRGVHWFDWVFRMEEKIKKYRNRKPKIAYVNPVQQKGRSPMETDKQKKLDAILDKISKSGYESLSAADKEFLFTMSKDK